MLESIGKVKQWAHDRNLIEGSDSITQYLKLVSELGELADDVNKKQDVRDSIGDCLVVLIIIAEQYNIPFEWPISDSVKLGGKTPRDAVILLSMDVGYLGYTLNYNAEYNSIKRDLIDCLHRLCITARVHNTTLEECLEHAYNEIKDRRGVMLDGVFIKENDGAYAAAVEILGKD